MEAITKGIAIMVIIARKSIIMVIAIVVKIVKGTIKVIKESTVVKAFTIAIEMEAIMELYSYVMVAIVFIKGIIIAKLEVGFAEERQVVVMVTEFIGKVKVGVAAKGELGGLD